MGNTLVWTNVDFWSREEFPPDWKSWSVCVRVCVCVCRWLVWKWGRAPQKHLEQHLLCFAHHQGSLFQCFFNYTIIVWEANFPDCFFPFPLASLCPFDWFSAIKSSYVSDNNNAKDQEVYCQDSSCLRGSSLTGTADGSQRNICTCTHLPV